MSPTPRAVSAIIETARAYVNGRARTGLLAWLLAAACVVLALAWLFAGAGGWESGTPLPLLLDGLLVAAAVVAWRALQSRRERWLAERTLSRSMERAAGLPRGAVRECLELERAVPRGTSEELARLAVDRSKRDPTVGHGEPESELAGDVRPGSHRAYGQRRGIGGLAVTAPARAARSSRLAAGRAPPSAWSGLGPVPWVAVGRARSLPPLELTPGQRSKCMRGSPLRCRSHVRG